MAKLNENQKILAMAGGGLVLCLAAGGGIWWAKGLVEEAKELRLVKSELEEAKRAHPNIAELVRDGAFR